MTSEQQAHRTETCIRNSTNVSKRECVGGKDTVV